MLNLLENPHSKKETAIHWLNFFPTCADVGKKMNY